MDQVLVHRQIIHGLLKEIYEMTVDQAPVETQLIMDDERGHYLLFSVGWHGRDWVYSSFVHIDLKPDGQVWLQHDGTSLKIAEELVKRGIPQHEIVPGFHKPSVRPLLDGWGVG